MGKKEKGKKDKRFQNEVYFEHNFEEEMGMNLCIYSWISQRIQNMLSFLLYLSPQPPSDHSITHAAPHAPLELHGCGLGHHNGCLH